MVPEFEEREAAISSGYTWPDWIALDESERAASVAHYRMRGVIAAHTQDAVDKAQERENRRKK